MNAESARPQWGTGAYVAAGGPAFTVTESRPLRIGPLCGCPIDGHVCGNERPAPSGSPCRCTTLGIDELRRYGWLNRATFGCPACLGLVAA